MNALSAGTSPVSIGILISQNNHCCSISKVDRSDLFGVRARSARLEALDQNITEYIGRRLYFKYNLCIEGSLPCLFQCGADIKVDLAVVAGKIPNHDLGTVTTSEEYFIFTQFAALYIFFGIKNHVDAFVSCSSKCYGFGVQVDIFTGNRSIGRKHYQSVLSVLVSRIDQSRFRIYLDLYQRRSKCINCVFFTDSRHFIYRIEHHMLHLAGAVPETRAAFEELRRQELL